MSEYYDEHYSKMIVQPIALMQKVSSKEAFSHFLFLTAMKYHMRAGNKVGESYEKDIAKRDRYFSWRYAVDQKNEIIDPNKDYELPEVYKAMMIHNIEFARDVLINLKGETL